MKFLSKIFYCLALLAIGSSIFVQKNHCYSNDLLIVATEHNYPPYSFLDENGEVVGFNVDLTRAIARAGNLNVEIDYRPWSEIRKDLEQGNINAISGMYYSLERDQYVDFSQPYAVMHHAVFSRVGTPVIHHEDELQGKSLIVMRGDIMYDYVLEKGWVDNVVVTENQAEALQLLASGAHDYALIAKLPGLYWLRELQLANIVTNGPLLQSAKYCYAIKAGDSDLLFRISEALALVKETGEYRQLYDKWFGTLEPEEDHHLAIFKYLFIVLGVLFSFLLGSVFWSLSLKRQVQHRTAELAGEVALHKLADEALRQSELELNTIYDNAPLVMLLVDRDRCIVKMNALGLAMARCSKDEAVGRRGGDALRCIHSSESPDGCGFAPSCSTCGVRNTVLDTFKTGKGAHRVEASLCYAHVDGPVDMSMLVSTKMVEIKGEELVLICLEDITDRKHVEHEKSRLEVQLRQSQKMEAIGTLAGGIAHDFNNILGAILGYAEMALDGLTHEKQSSDDIRQVIRSGLRARDLIQQILTFSRQSEHEFSSVKLQPIVAETIKFLKHSIPATIEISQDIDDSCGPVFADSSQMSQVLMNLCTNSCHAMKGDNGILTLGLKSIDIDADLSSALSVPVGRYARLEVCDTGTGIAPDVLERIFEPFFTTKNIDEGSGLGLAVIHGIVKSCNGFIKVASILGTGTTFHLYFPELGESAFVEFALETIPCGDEHILIVDDDVELSQMLERMVVSLGYTAIAFIDSGQALETFAKNPYQYDLVLTDVTMPKMTGDVLAQKMREINPDIRVLFCTGYSELFNEDEDCVDCIFKPVIKSDLAKRIRQILDQG